MSVLLIVVFGGETHALIPLYAVGVFTSFTLSQAGMVVHWKRFPEPGSRWSMVVNGVGRDGDVRRAARRRLREVRGRRVDRHRAHPGRSCCTCAGSRGTTRTVTDRLALPEAEAACLDWQSMNRLHNHVIVLVSGIDRRIVRALQYAKTLKADKVEARLRRRHRRQGRAR